MYIDLFSGCGGLALGMHQAGWKALFAVEKNEDAFKTLSYNLIENNEHFLWPEWLPKTTQDINKLIEKYEPELKQLSSKITLVAGGPPCQGFSTAGRRDETDIRNSLVDSYLRFIDIVEPDSLLFENVKGFTQSFKKNRETENGKNYAAYILEQLKRRGYRVKAKMIDFSAYGVPQRRVRFILFASKTLDPKLFFKTLKKDAPAFLKEKRLTRRVNIKQAISDLEYKNGTVACPDSKGFSSGKYGPAKTKYQRYCRQGIGKENIPDSHRFARHRQGTTDRFIQLLAKSDIRNKNISHLLMEDYNVKKNCFSVLSPDIPSPTLTSNPDDHIHYCEPRTLTVREYARIQSFPDWYEFKGSYTTGGKRRKLEVPRYTQIGNAIPPLFAEQVGRVISKLLEDSEKAKMDKPQ